jgi:hypothetical protein
MIGQELERRSPYCASRQPLWRLIPRPASVHRDGDSGSRPESHSDSRALKVVTEAFVAVGSPNASAFPIHRDEKHVFDFEDGPCSEPTRPTLQNCRRKAVSLTSDRSEGYLGTENDMGPMVQESFCWMLIRKLTIDFCYRREL